MKSYLPSVQPEQFRELLSLLSEQTDRDGASLRGLGDALYSLSVPLSLSRDEWELMHQWIESNPHAGAGAYPLDSACVAMADNALSAVNSSPSADVVGSPLELVTRGVVIRETTDFWFSVQRFAGRRGVTLEGGLSRLVRLGLELWAAGRLEVVH